MYGRLFTVSGVLCAFRKRALEEAGWWSPRTLTDDIDVTWRVQLAGWRVVYEPNAIVWILMPETLRGLWRQRLRWAEGGVADDDRLLPADDPRPRAEPAADLPQLRAEPALGLLHAVRADRRHPVGRWACPLPAILPGFGLVPEWWGLTLTLTYLAQALVSHLRRAPLRAEHAARLFWIIWYPLAFWLLSTLTTVAALPRALVRPRRSTWESPDRGLR